MTTKRPHSRRAKVQTWVSIATWKRAQNVPPFVLPIKIRWFKYGTELEWAITTWGRTNQIFSHCSAPQRIGWNSLLCVQIFKNNKFLLLNPHVSHCGVTVGGFVGLGKSPGWGHCWNKGGPYEKVVRKVWPHISFQECPNSTYQCTSWPFCP